jgi:hypothetical protein
MKWARPLCGLAATGQNDFKTSEIISPQEASLMRKEMSVLGLDIAKRVMCQHFSGHKISLVFKACS